MRPALRIAILAALAAPGAHAADDFSSFFAEGKPLIDVRARYEYVDDDAFAETAHATTVRTRLGFKTGTWNGVSLLVEAEDVRALGSEDYNSSANGRTRFPTIADPEGSEWNQAYVDYDGGANGFKATLGRQRFMLDNQRFFGNVGWRQNEQTFDALATSYQFKDGPLLRYAYLGKAHRVFGHYNPNPLLAHLDLDAHIFHVDQPTPIGNLAGYAYLV
jgi:hypothetical protein